MNNENLNYKRHTLSHILASVLIEKYPGTLLTLGPAIDNGFYYDIDFMENQKPNTEEDFKQITELMKEVVEKVGLTWDVKTETTNYSNFFILKTELYKDFVNNYCIPALEYMESDDRFIVNFTYDVGLSKELLKEHTELEHYPMIPFIMERLILFYISSKQFKTLNLI